MNRARPFERAIQEALTNLAAVAKPVNQAMVDGLVRLSRAWEQSMLESAARRDRATDPPEPTATSEEKPT